MKTFKSWDHPVYAETVWCVEDVKSIRPSWPLERCEFELQKIERYMRDRLVELGWEVMEDLLPAENEKEKT